MIRKNYFKIFYIFILLNLIQQKLVISSNLDDKINKTSFSPKRLSVDNDEIEKSPTKRRRLASESIVPNLSNEETEFTGSVPSSLEEEDECSDTSSKDEESEFSEPISSLEEENEYIEEDNLAKQVILRKIRIGLIEENSYEKLLEKIRKIDGMNEKDLPKFLNGKLFYISKSTNPTLWQEFLSATTEYPEPTTYLQNSALIIIEKTINEKAIKFAIPFGRSQFKELNFLEPDFGFKVAYNGINVEEVKGYTSTKQVGSVRKQKSVTLNPPSLVPLEQLGGNLGRLKDKCYEGKGPYVSVTEKIETLEQLPLVCDKVYNLFSEIENSEGISSKFKVVRDDKIIKDLNSKLIKDFKKWMFFTPEFLTIDSETHYLNKSKKEYTLEEIFDKLKEKSFFNDCSNEIDKLSRLKKWKIKYVDSEKTEEKFSIYSHIYYTTSIEKVTYSLIDGFWRKIDTDYAKNINDFVENLYESSKLRATYFLPKRKKESEAEYNLRMVKETNNKFLLMDQRDIKPAGEKTTSVEMCDLIELEAKKLIHVKVGNKSSDLSHLFSQGFGSAEILRNDVCYIEKLKYKFVRCELIEYIKNHFSTTFNDISNKFKEKILLSSIIDRQAKIDVLKQIYTETFAENNINVSSIVLEKIKETREFKKEKDENVFLLGAFKKQFVKIFTSNFNEACNKNHSQAREKQIIEDLIIESGKILGKKFDDNLKETFYNICEENREKFHDVLYQKDETFTPSNFTILFAIVFDKQKVNVLQAIPFLSRITLKKYVENIKKLDYKVGLQLVFSEQQRKKMTDHFIRK